MTTEIRITHMSGGHNDVTVQTYNPKGEQSPPTQPFNLKAGESINICVYDSKAFSVVEVTNEEMARRKEQAASEMFKDFKPFEAKPVTRMALEITDVQLLKFIAGDAWSYNEILFKAHQNVVVGDYICRLTLEDTYHVSKAVFHERNIVPTP